MRRRIERVAAHDPERAEEMRRQWESQQNGGAPVHSGEYGTLIIHAMETNQPTVVYGNVANHGLIDNLPTGCSVEVPCLVDGAGVQPVRVGELPPQLAGLMRTSINVQDLTVRASLERRRDYVYHAAMLDPHTAAELTLDEIYSLVDDLIEAHGDYIPAFER
jgi:alpha-galactosidase